MTAGACWAVLSIFAILMLLAACTTTRKVSRLTTLDGGPTEGEGRLGIVLMPLDIELTRLTAGGLHQPDAVWTDAARAYLHEALDRQLAARGIDLVSYDEATIEPAEREMHRRLIHLHAVVGRAILSHVFSGKPLPTKGRRLDWSLGPTARSIARTTGAGHALFIHVRDSYTTAGRRILQIAAAAFGVAVPVGETDAFASLVDLKTGDIVWFETLHSPVGDLRRPEPAAKLATVLLAKLPAGQGPAARGPGP
ncbi:MAG: hypothetical protein D6757_10955 [Alphaproteobacteria bacterium]|nr:MAG: hypothetical protein D6757_10955 [Alphaproteobacteria bacterium]